MKIKFNIFPYAVAILSATALSSHAADNSLPPEVQADVLLTKAKSNMDAGQWADAVLAFQKVATLNVPIPDEYYFQYGKALLASKDSKKAVEEMTIYVVKAGEKGSRFEEAVSNLCENVDGPQLSTNIVDTLRTVIINKFIQQDARAQRWGYAANDFSELARLCDLSAELVYQRAIICRKCGRVKQAYDLISTYLKLIQRGSEHYQDAIKMFGEYENWESLEEANPHVVSARKAARERDWLEAAAQAMKAITIDAGNEEAKVTLKSTVEPLVVVGNNAKQASDWQGAKQVGELLLSINSTNQKANDLINWAEKKKNEIELAQQQERQQKREKLQALKQELAKNEKEFWDGARMIWPNLGIIIFDGSGDSGFDGIDFEIVGTSDKRINITRKSEEPGSRDVRTEKWSGIKPEMISSITVYEETSHKARLCIYFNSNSTPTVDVEVGNDHKTDGFKKMETALENMRQNQSEISAYDVSE